MCEKSVVVGSGSVVVVVVVVEVGVEVCAFSDPISLSSSSMIAVETFVVPKNSHISHVSQNEKKKSNSPAPIFSK